MTWTSFANNRGSVFARDGARVDRSSSEGVNPGLNLQSRPGITFPPPPFQVTLLTREWRDEGEAEDGTEDTGTRYSIRNCTTLKIHDDSNKHCMPDAVGVRSFHACIY